MANRHFANNNGNVAHLDPIGSAAYDINIPGSDYDFVLRFKNSAVLEGDSLLLGDWRGDDHDGLGHPKKGYTISQNMSNQTKTNPFGTGGNQEILRPLNFETSKCECTNQQQSDGIASWDGKRDSGIQGSSGWLMTYSFLGEISVRSSRGILGNILNHLETSPHWKIPTNCENILNVDTETGTIVASNLHGWNVVPTNPGRFSSRTEEAVASDACVVGRWTDQGHFHTSFANGWGATCSWWGGVVWVWQGAIFQPRGP